MHILAMRRIRTGVGYGRQTALLSSERCLSLNWERCCRFSRLMEWTNVQCITAPRPNLNHKAAK